eukprot:6877815-Heterocapsa_arctica.AAC.1
MGLFWSWPGRCGPPWETLPRASNPHNQQMINMLCIIKRCVVCPETFTTQASIMECVVYSQGCQLQLAIALAGSNHADISQAPPAQARDGGAQGQQAAEATRGSTDHVLQ